MNKTSPFIMLIRLVVAFFLLFGAMITAFSQVKIGNNPTVVDPSAILEIESTSKGVLEPRLTTAQRTAIVSPASGLEVYDTDTKSFWYYDGTSWVNGSNQNIYNSNGTLTGNRTVTQGANTLSFTGSAVNAFSVDGTTFSVDAANNAIGFGTASPNAEAIVDATAVNKGILFPRMALSATDNASPLSTFVAGMTVYNTASAGSGTTNVTPGLYYSDGTKWVAVGNDNAEDQTLGSIAIFPMNSLPSNYLECNGAAVSRTVYADLFAKIGTTYGAGDGSTTFNLPDLRGEFVRGYDNGRGADAGRTLGSSQAAATAMPNTAFTTNTVAAHTHSVDPASQSTSTDGGHAHSIGRRSNPWNDAYDGGDGRRWENSASTTDRGYLGTFATTSDGAHSHTLDIPAVTSSAAGGHNHTLTGGDAETRPRNVAMVYAIKAVESVLIPSSTTTAVTAAAALNEPWFKAGTATGATSNTDNVYINGNVGVHNNTPTNTLTVGNAAGTSGNAILVNPAGGVEGGEIVLAKDLTYGTTNWTIDQYGGAGTVADEPRLRIVNNNGEMMSMKENGNVGIGTSNPSQKLHVVGNLLVNASAITGQTGVIIRPSVGNSSTGYAPLLLQNIAGNNVFKIQQEVGTLDANITFLTDAYDNGATEQARMVIQRATGNIGIGTVTPNAPLQFANTTVNRKIVLWEGANNDHQYFGFGVNGSVLRYQLNTTTDSHIFYAGTSASTSNQLMRITGTGLVGIGTTAPQAKLDLLGAKSTGFSNGTGGSSYGPAYAIIPGGAAGTSILNDFPNGWFGGLSTFDVVGASCYFGGYITRSDSTLKKDIQTMGNPIVDNFMKIRPVTYLMKEQTPEMAGLQYGFIAQEIGELFPSLVTTKSDPSGTIGMNYQGLIAPTVYMVQEQERKVEQQQKEIDQQQLIIGKQLEQFKEQTSVISDLQKQLELMLLELQALKTVPNQTGSTAASR